MENAIDLCQESGDTNATFHAKVGTIKDINDKDLAEAKRKKKEVARVHRRTMQKGLHDPDNHDGIVTHLEPDILD